MKRSGTFLLLIAVLGLGAYILLVDQHRESTPERQEELRRAFRIDPDRTTFLGIRRAEYHIELERVQQECLLPFAALSFCQVGMFFC